MRELHSGVAIFRRWWEVNQQASTLIGPGIGFKLRHAFAGDPLCSGPQTCSREGQKGLMQPKLES